MGNVVKIAERFRHEVGDGAVILMGLTGCKNVVLGMITIMKELYENLDKMVAELRELWKLKDEEVKAGESDAYTTGRLTNAQGKIDLFEVRANEAKQNWQQYESILRNFTLSSEEIKKDIAAV